MSPAFLEAFCNRLSIDLQITNQTKKTLVKPVTYIHSVPTGRNLAGVTLGQSPVERVGKGIFPQVREKFFIDLESREVRRISEGLGGESLDNCRLVSRGVEELVVYDLNIGVVGGELDDLVGDSLGIREGWDVLANARKGEGDVLGVSSAQLGTGLLADENQVGRLFASAEAAAHET